VNKWILEPETVIQSHSKYRPEQVLMHISVNVHSSKCTVMALAL